MPFWFAVLYSETCCVPLCNFENLLLDSPVGLRASPCTFTVPGNVQNSYALVLENVIELLWFLLSISLVLALWKPYYSIILLDYFSNFLFSHFPFLWLSALLPIQLPFNSSITLFFFLLSYYLASKVIHIDTHRYIVFSMVLLPSLCLVINSYMAWCCPFRSPLSCDITQVVTQLFPVPV